MKTLISLLILAASLSTQMAMAAQDFQKQVLEAQRSCPRLNCPTTSVQVIPYTSSELRMIPRELRSQLKNLAINFANEIWPDTILEGSYQSADHYRIDGLEKVLIKGEQVGYRITYSDKAWNTDTCNYDPLIPGSLADCQTGRITESAFISLDLQTTLRDEAAWATFSPDGPVQTGLDD